MTKKYGLVEVSPADLRYAQDSIKGRFKDGTKLDESFRELAADPSHVENLPPITVMYWDNGRMFAVDGNRRLFLFKLLHEMKAIKTITVNITPFDQRKFNQAHTTDTDGESIEVRHVSSTQGFRKYLKRIWHEAQRDKTGQSTPPRIRQARLNKTSAKKSQDAQDRRVQNTTNSISTPAAAVASQPVKPQQLQQSQGCKVYSQGQPNIAVTDDYSNYLDNYPRFQTATWGLPGQNVTPSAQGQTVNTAPVRTSKQPDKKALAPRQPNTVSLPSRQPRSTAYLPPGQPNRPTVSRVSNHLDTGPHRSRQLNVNPQATRRLDSPREESPPSRLTSDIAVCLYDEEPRRPWYKRLFCCC